MSHSEDLLNDVMYKAYELGIQDQVFNVVSRISQSTYMHDTHSIAQVYEQAFNIVTNGDTKQGGDNTLTK
jgi:hypothetical protein